MPELIQADFTRLRAIFTADKITYIPSHDIWLFADARDHMAEAVVKQYISLRAVNTLPREALLKIGFPAGLNPEILERHPAIRDRILKPQAGAVDRGGDERIEVSIRPHVTYGVHRYIAYGGAGSSETLASGLTLPRAQEMAQVMADTINGTELYSMVASETIYVNQENGAQEVPAAFEHIHQSLLEQPLGASITLSLVNLRQGDKKRAALRIVRHIPVPVKPPEEVDPYDHDGTEWDVLTEAEQRQMDRALCGLPRAAAKLMRLGAYRARNTGLLEALNRIGAATDVADPSGHYPTFSMEAIY